MVRRSGAQSVVPSGGQVVGGGSGVAVRWAGWGRSGEHEAARWQGVQVDQCWGSGQVVGLPGEQVVGQ